MDGLDQAVSVERLLLAIAGILVALAASLHAVLHKRDSRATVLWVAFIWLSPFLGRRSTCCSVLTASNGARFRCGAT